MSAQLGHLLVVMSINCFLPTDILAMVLVCMFHTHNTPIKTDHNCVYYTFMM